MSTGLHADLEVGEIHRIQSLEYANASARTGASGFVADDIGRIARQTDDNSFWVLTATTPTWVEITGAGGGAHDLGGSTHNADTLANLNSKVSDATLIDTNDSRLSDARTPTSHATSHEPGGGDAMSVDAAAATGSLRTIGTGAQQACAGNDSRLSDARTPTSHATSHEPGGGDAMSVDAAAGTGSLRTIGTGAQQACAGNDSRLSDARTPTSHASSHQSGGGDAIKLDDLGAPDDNTDLDASTSKHGLLPKLGGGTTNYLRADGTWAAPSGGGVFGSNLYYYEDLTFHNTISEGTPVTVFNQSTPALPSGTYYWHLSFQAGKTDSANYKCIFQVFVDDVEFDGIELEDAIGAYWMSLHRHQTFSAAANFKIKYYVDNDANRATIDNICLSLWRVS